MDNDYYTKLQKKKKKKITHDSYWSHVVQLDTEQFANLSFFKKKNSTLPQFCMVSQLSKIASLV